MATSNSSTSKLSLKVAISEESSNVVFAEVDGNVVNVLVTFLKLPLIDIVRILEKHFAGEAPLIGSLTTLYKSSVHVDGKTFEKILGNSSDSFQAEDLVENSATFIILDDLRVVPVVSGSIQTLTTLGFTQIETAGLTTVTIDDDDVMDLLKFSLSSMTPLTDLIHKKSQKSFCKATQKSRFEFVNFERAYIIPKMVLKILTQKSTGRFLLAEASDDFVKYLFRFFNVSLGGAALVMGENPYFKNLKNLNHSARNVIDEKYLNPGDTLEKLWDQQLHDTLRLLTFRPEESFIKYIIRDDLTVEPSNLTSTFSILNSFGVSFSDVNEMDVQISLNQAYNIVSASLSSTTVFTDLMSNLVTNNSSKEE